MLSILVLSIIHGLLFSYLTSNELYNSQCYHTLWLGYYSQRKILIYSCAISPFQWLGTSLLFLTEQGDGLKGLCLLHFNGMETSAIALTDKVILELDSQVLSYVKLIACEASQTRKLSQLKFFYFILFLFLFLLFFSVNFLPSMFGIRNVLALLCWLTQRRQALLCWLTQRRKSLCSNYLLCSTLTS